MEGIPYYSVDVCGIQTTFHSQMRCSSLNVIGGFTPVLLKGLHAVSSTYSRLSSRSIFTIFRSFNLLPNPSVSRHIRHRIPTLVTRPYTASRPCVESCPKYSPGTSSCSAAPTAVAPAPLIFSSSTSTEAKRAFSTQIRAVDVSQWSVSRRRTRSARSKTATPRTGEGGMLMRCEEVRVHCQTPPSEQTE